MVASYLDVDHVGLDDVEAVGVDQVVDQMNSFLKIIFELEFQLGLLYIQTLINPELLY
jgi:hypothetical protein